MASPRFKSGAFELNTMYSISQLKYFVYVPLKTRIFGVAQRGRSLYAYNLNIGDNVNCRCLPWIR